MLKIVFCSLVILISTSVFAQSTDVASKMKSFNSYLKLIDAELKIDAPRVEEFEKIANLILNTGYELKESKRNTAFHKNLDQLLRDAQSLLLYAKKNKYQETLSQARSIKNNCINCHIQQLKNKKK